MCNRAPLMEEAGGRRGQAYGRLAYGADAGMACGCLRVMPGMIWGAAVSLALVTIHGGERRAMTSNCLRVWAFLIAMGS